MNKKTVLSASLLFLIAFASLTYSSDAPVNPSARTYTVEQIRGIAEGFVNNSMGIENPAIVDVDGDGNFDILAFKNGNVEYYRNTGTNEKPVFVAENMHYDKYKTAFLMGGSLPYPIFFADKNGDGKPDMFVIKDKVFNPGTQKNEYKVLYSENALDLDTGTLITIILVLVIVLLLLAILH